MSIMYLACGGRRARALARAVSDLSEDSFKDTRELKDSYEFTEDCNGVVIVGYPMTIFDPEEEYQKFLNQAGEKNIKVAGILLTKNVDAFPNNNKGIGKVIQAGRRKVKDLAGELNGFFEQGNDKKVEGGI